MDLLDKVAFISGGAGSIGCATARALLAAGARVVIADISRERADSVARAVGNPARAIAVQLDVTDEASWTAARRATETSLGSCDVLISNAGVSFTSPLDEFPIDAWKWVYDVNINGALHGLRTFLPGMKARGTPGHVLFTCSITALRPFANQGAYTTSKAALLNLASVLKLELASTCIGVTVLCPGIVNSDLRENAFLARPAALRSAISGLPTTSVKMGMSAVCVGRAAVAAIEANAFYAFTHPDYRHAVNTERERMLAAMSTSAEPGYDEPEQLTKPMAL